MTRWTASNDLRRSHCFLCFNVSKKLRIITNITALLISMAIKPLQLSIFLDFNVILNNKTVLLVKTGLKAYLII